jgi:hypothetical protein
MGPAARAWMVMRQMAWIMMSLKERRGAVMMMMRRIMETG